MPTTFVLIRHAQGTHNVDFYNIGGAEQSSASYRLNETIGETGSGDSSNESYKTILLPPSGSRPIPKFVTKNNGILGSTQPKDCSSHEVKLCKIFHTRRK
jgi:hypothetical protein